MTILQEIRIYDHPKLQYVFMYNYNKEGSTNTYHIPATIMTQVKTGILSGERFLNQLVTYNSNKKLTNRSIVAEIKPIIFLHFNNITTILKT